MRLDQLIAATSDDAKRLIKRLRRHRHEMLTFLDHEELSPYNNHAEKQMRTAVHTRKVRHQNHSSQGAKPHAIFLSLFRAAQLQGLKPVDYVLRLAISALACESTDMITPEQFQRAA